MSPILIVLPILVVLMFGLGLGFQWREVVALARAAACTGDRLGRTDYIVAVIGAWLGAGVSSRGLFFHGIGVDCLFTGW